MLNDRVKVWDPLVRFFHWSLVVAFFVAYFTEPENSGLAVHVWAGYFIGGIVVLRVVWGFAGTPHARFADFAFGPFQALRYFGRLLRGKTPRYIGHTPAGAWMIYALLLILAATVFSGMTVLAKERHAGPLALLYTQSATLNVESVRRNERAPATDKINGGDAYEGAGESREDVMEEAHEVLANVALALVLLHILGVLVTSVVHRENLVRAMVTGYKRSD